MKSNLDMQPEHLEIVKQILRKHLSPQVKVWVFGSRARGNAKRYSDLDLVFDAGSPLALKIISDLSYDFEESSLPYKVDLVDWHAIDDSFRNIILKERIQLA